MSAAKHVGRKRRPAPVRPKLYYPGQVWTVESLKVAWVAARCMGLERMIFERQDEALMRCSLVERAVARRKWMIGKNHLRWFNHGLDGRRIVMQSSCGFEAVLLKLGTAVWDLAALEVNEE